jgi:acyl-phosphate glycerol 3-phosphate acyltransferase
VLLIDIGKGVLVVRFLPGPRCRWHCPDPEVSREWLTLACGLPVIVGHVYPVWFGFRGGKGAATVVGVIAALEPRLLLPLLVSWLLVLVLTGYVGLATMLAGIALVAAVYVLEPGNTPLLGFCAVLAAFIVFTHRSNIKRMWAGNENGCGVYGCFARARRSSAGCSTAGAARSARRRPAALGREPRRGTRRQSRRVWKASSACARSGSSCKPSRDADIG